MRAALTPLLVIAALAALAPACADDPAPALLQSADLKKPEGNAKFDRNVVIDAASFTDIETVKPEEVQKFLGKTPYERPSFLETYQSNGVRAVDAIMRASRVHRINPLVFLVFAQITQGLLGERNYPFPPERVEYVFRCGCLQGNDCLPELAGFDRQVDCLGRQLRVALTAISTSDETTGGWGKDKTSITLDNLKVTPANEATAAIYDRSPRVAEGSAGGAWFFWNLFRVYAVGADYSGPIGGAAGGGWIGDGCTSSAACSGVGEGALCATGDYPGGLCTIKCTGDCPVGADKPESFCADFKTNGGFCLSVCNLTAPSCRDGYKCVTTKKLGSTAAADSKPICTIQ